MSDDFKTYCVRFVEQRHMSITINARSAEQADAIAEWLWLNDMRSHRFCEMERDAFEAAFTEEVTS